METNSWTDEGRSSNGSCSERICVPVVQDISLICDYLPFPINSSFLPCICSDKNELVPQKRHEHMNNADRWLRWPSLGKSNIWILDGSDIMGKCLFCNGLRGSRFSKPFAADWFSGTKVVEVEEGVVGAHVACTSVWNSFSGPSEWNLEESGWCNHWFEVVKYNIQHCVLLYIYVYSGLAT